MGHDEMERQQQLGVQRGVEVASRTRMGVDLRWE